MKLVQRLKVTVAFPRTIPRESLPKVKTYAERVGRLLWAWNRMHAAFANIFSALIDKNDMRVGLAVWHAVKADTGQREMLKAMLPLRSSLRPEVSEGIRWLLSIAGILSQHRNDIAHTPMAQDNRGVYPDAAGDPPRVARLNRNDLARFHRVLTNDLIALSSYARYLASGVQNPAKVLPSPERPRLRSIPHSNVPANRSQKGRHAQKRRPLRRRPASRAKYKPKGEN